MDGLGQLMRSISQITSPLPMTRTMGQGNRVMNHLSIKDIPKPAFVYCTGKVESSYTRILVSQCLTQSTGTDSDSAAACYINPMGWRSSRGLGLVTPAAAGTRNANTTVGPEVPFARAIA